VWRDAASSLESLDVGMVTCPPSPCPSEKVSPATAEVHLGRDMTPGYTGFALPCGSFASTAHPLLSMNFNRGQ
jgi:hypothetical protein